MTDCEWALIEPHLSVAATGPLPRRVRDQFNGILWRFRTGSGWRRDVPERYGPWSTVYSRFNGWAKAGVFRALMDALIAEATARGRSDWSWSAWTPRSCGRTRSRPDWRSPGRPWTRWSRR
ncbi:transposase [Sinosporangium album]|uniref:transposase n=1 Tax=Sinosporangium album TaxID=504805 RepID=UPI0015A0F91F